MTIRDLKTVRTLATGAFGQVDLVQIPGQSRMSYALKKIPKFKLKEEWERRQLLSEKALMEEAANNFIVKLYKTYKDNKYLYLLMEVCLGGDLGDLLDSRKCFKPKAAKFYIACTLEALEFLHSRNIVYRDLKPENLLLDKRGYLKLCDFGFAKRLEAGSRTNSFCGTPEYIAPEIIEEDSDHDISADYWSLGVLMYELLTGKIAFDGSNSISIYNKILRGTVEMTFPKTMGKNSTNLFLQLCKTNPSERLGYHNGGVNKIREHTWFYRFDFEGLREGTLEPPIAPVVKHRRDTRNFNEEISIEEPPPDDFSDWDETF